MRIEFKNADKIIEQIKSLRRRRSLPIQRYINNCVDCAELQRMVSKADTRKSIKNLAKKNAIVNLITSLEVFLKELIQLNHENWNENGLEELLKDKVTLSHAYDLLSAYRPSKSDLISNHYSFQSLESVDTVFNKLTGKRFLNLVGEYGYKFQDFEKALFKVDELVFDRDLPSWRATLIDIFKLRHQAVHESTDNVDFDIEIYDITIFMTQFGLAVWKVCYCKEFH